MTATQAIPRFNHVAMSLPAEALAEVGRADLLAFYGEVFGWTEMPTMTVDRERLVLRCHSHEQFVFLHAEDFTVLQLHSFYVRYLLPLVVEVQCYAWADGFDDQTGT